MSIPLLANQDLIPVLNQLDAKNFSDKKRFWRTVKPIFRDRVNYTKANFLVEKMN